MPSIAKIIEIALSNLKPRQKNVLVARFALDGKGDGETLAAIGEKFGITRERVRQIEASGIALARANMAKSSESSAFIEKVKKYIASKGGVAKREDVAKYAASISRGTQDSQLDFVAESSGAFKLHRGDESFYPFYYIGQKDLKNAKDFIEGWAGRLQSRKDEILNAGSIGYAVQLASYTKSESLPSPVAENYLGVAKHIRENPYGDKGLRSWPEIVPATVRDKIYLVLKKKKKPLHFEDIAKHINDAKFDDGGRALAPTVHNELIKDKRFVLVGRGIYGLKEHGYEPSTAREVIKRLLKKNPLKAHEVIEAVNRERFFKPNTILINLQNRNFFERMSDGRYRVKES